AQFPDGIQDHSQAARDRFATARKCLESRRVERACANTRSKFETRVGLLCGKPCLRETDQQRQPLHKSLGAAGQGEGDATPPLTARGITRTWPGSELRLESITASLLNAET